MAESEEERAFRLLGTLPGGVPLPPSVAHSSPLLRHPLYPEGGRVASGVAFGGGASVAAEAEAAEPMHGIAAPDDSADRELSRLPPVPLAAVSGQQQRQPPRQS